MEKFATIHHLIQHQYSVKDYWTLPDGRCNKA